MHRSVLAILFLLSGVLAGVITPVTRAQDVPVCGDAPAPRLVIGQQGYVTQEEGPPAPLNVRDAPSLSGARVGQLPEGTFFDVLDGPVCADNIFWWQVTGPDGLTGWAAEGLSGDYFVEPVAPPEMGDCGPVTRLATDRFAVPLPGVELEALDDPGSGPSDGLFTREVPFRVEDIDPVCLDGVLWYYMREDLERIEGWVPESDGSRYLIEPYVFQPPQPTAYTGPLNAPQVTVFDHPLPEVLPTPAPDTLVTSFFTWDWDAVDSPFTFDVAPDPLALTMPAAYAGNMPDLPVDLSDVYFVDRANLNDAQLALLAQNGFVVVPAGINHFDNAFDRWPHDEGLGDFITTDMMLHALYQVFENTLMHMEREVFFAKVANFAGRGLWAAQDLITTYAGTPLEQAARNAAAYYAVPVMLMEEASLYYTSGFDFASFDESELAPSRVLAETDPAIIAAAQPVVDLIMAAEGRHNVPFMDEYQEDFSQYIVRGYYEGDPVLEGYFRAMMWLGRITFRTRSVPDTQTGLMVLRALQDDPLALADLQGMSETLTFLVGPLDDLSPADYAPLVAQFFPDGDYADADALDGFLAAVAELPGPRVNSIPLPIGVTEGEVDDLTRGFRLFGQRFTFDGYAMQQLIYPAVGTQDNSRTLPMGLDVAATLGSDTAYALADDAGATDYLNYTANLAALRDQVTTIDSTAWMENIAGGWLWTLQPLLVYDTDVLPPLMQTDAWRRKDLHTALASWTQLKHATLLYAEQPMGGLGGGGFIPPVTSYSFVEPNPEVFARIALVAGGLRLGLAEQGMIGENLYRSATGQMAATASTVAGLSARFAEIARMQIAGEPISYETYYWLQERMQGAYSIIRYYVELLQSDPPPNMAITADVASNPSSGEALQQAVGLVDYIYVVVEHPLGLQVVRGPVYSYYEFIVPVDQRMTDSQWRERIRAGTQPPRPSWIDLFYGG